jgi:hypothetical protein
MNVTTVVVIQCVSGIKHSVNQQLNAPADRIMGKSKRCLYAGDINVYIQPISFLDEVGDVEGHLVDLGVAALSVYIIYNCRIGSSEGWSNPKRK